MADYAKVSISLERPYGIPFRKGDLVAGTFQVRGRGGSLLDLGNDTEIEATPYEKNNGSEWEEASGTINFSETSDTGVYEFTYDPPKGEMSYRLRFVLTGDYQAVADVTAQVLDRFDLED